MQKSTDQLTSVGIAHACPNNYYRLQEIEAIVGGGQIFDTGLFFTRLR